jgi:hypothetical protein
MKHALRKGRSTIENAWNVRELEAEAEAAPAIIEQKSERQHLKGRKWSNAWRQGKALANMATYREGLNWSAWRPTVVAISWSKVP